MPFILLGILVWTNIWLESDSSYVHFLNSNSCKVPWKLEIIGLEFYFEKNMINFLYNKIGVLPAHFCLDKDLKYVYMEEPILVLINWLILEF